MSYSRTAFDAASTEPECDAMGYIFASLRHIAEEPALVITSYPHGVLKLDLCHPITGARATIIEVRE